MYFCVKLYTYSTKCFNLNATLYTAKGLKMFSPSSHKISNPFFLNIEGQAKGFVSQHDEIVGFNSLAAVNLPDDGLALAVHHPLVLSIQFVPKPDHLLFHIVL